jgi:hypothetical protein
VSASSFRFLAIRNTPARVCCKEYARVLTQPDDPHRVPKLGREPLVPQPFRRLRARRCSRGVDRTWSQPRPTAVRESATDLPRAATCPCAERAGASRRAEAGRGRVRACLLTIYISEAHPTTKGGGDGSVPSPVHLSHAARPSGSENFVRSQPRACSESHWEANYIVQGDGRRIRSWDVSQEARLPRRTPGCSPPGGSSESWRSCVAAAPSRCRPTARRSSTHGRTARAPT